MEMLSGRPVSGSAACLVFAGHVARLQPARPEGAVRREERRLYEDFCGVEGRVAGEIAGVAAGMFTPEGTKVRHGADLMDPSSRPWRSFGGLYRETNVSL
jgi:hypothetical protein